MSTNKISIVCQAAGDNVSVFPNAVRCNTNTRPVIRVRCTAHYKSLQDAAATTDTSLCLMRLFTTSELPFRCYQQ